MHSCLTDLAIPACLISHAGAADVQCAAGTHYVKEDLKQSKA
jgi:hypothetical protein